MAGIFYSLEETIDKLGKTEGEINALVKEGKLREFRDGAKILFKVTDVDALIPDVSEVIDGVELSDVSKAASAADGSVVELMPDETGEAEGIAAIR